MQSETAYVRSQTLHRIPGFARFAKVILGSPRQQLLYLLHTGYATANHNPTQSVITQTLTPDTNPNSYPNGNNPYPDPK